MSVTFHPIHLGDRRRMAQGWLITADGALRGIMSGDADGTVHFGFACDRRIAPEDGYMRFKDLAQARAWVVKRLAAAPRRGPSGPFADRPSPVSRPSDVP